MIFRKHDGQLIEINKSQFTNDKIYYNKILTFKFNITKVNSIYDKKSDTSKIIDKYLK